MKATISFKLLTALLLSFVLAACANNAKQDEAQPEEAPATQTQTTPYDSQAVDTTPVEQEQPAVEITRVYYFAFDDSSLSSDVRAELDVVAKVLKASGEKVRLEGNTDERGTREYNLALGDRRAQSVANYLIVQGVSKDQLEVVSYGEEKPAALGSNEQAWSKNRRVELVNK